MPFNFPSAVHFFIALCLLSYPHCGLDALPGYSLHLRWAIIYSLYLIIPSSFNCPWKLPYLGTLEVMAASGDTNANAIACYGDKNSTLKEDDANSGQRTNLSNDDPERIVVPCPLVDKAQQDPFGSEANAAVKYRTLSWM